MSRRSDKTERTPLGFFVYRHRPPRTRQPTSRCFAWKNEHRESTEADGQPNHHMKRSSSSTQCASLACRRSAPLSRLVADCGWLDKLW